MEARYSCSQNERAKLMIIFFNLVGGMMDVAKISGIVAVLFIISLDLYMLYTTPQ
jgi:hypothetical protein